MAESLLTPELTDEQYKLEIADMMARVEVSNEESIRRRAEIEELKAQSRVLMTRIEAAVQRLESRDAN